MSDKETQVIDELEKKLSQSTEGSGLQNKIGEIIEVVSGTIVMGLRHFSIYDTGNPNSTNPCHILEETLSDGSKGYSVRIFDKEHDCVTLDCYDEKAARLIQLAIESHSC